MQYNIKEISKIVEGELILNGVTTKLHNIIYDTRKITFPEASVFFAFKTINGDGHFFIDDAFEKGIKNFVVSQDIDYSKYKNCNFLIVRNTLDSLQKLARYHRGLFNIPVIAITGSNGKTILKEWLNNALSKKYKVVQSPNSYNSQIGVALSLLQINSSHEIALIEAGISKKGEMAKLENMVRPTMGVLTNIGDAHSLGFTNNQEKIIEKTSLFTHARKVIFNNDKELISNILHNNTLIEKQSWGQEKSATFLIKEHKVESTNTLINFTSGTNKALFKIPFTQKEFVDLSIHLIVCLQDLGFNENEINEALCNIDLLPNRLQIKDGAYNSILINDSYSTDLSSMQLALEYQDQYSKGLPKVLIFSDFEQQINKESTYNGLIDLFTQKNINRFIAIGIATKYKALFSHLPIEFFDDKNDLIEHLENFPIQKSCILIKGARPYKLEELFDKLSSVFHQTTLETNFSALENNLTVYKEYLNNDTQIMAVIKADAYGSGSVAISDFLQQKRIDYLAVALIDEAIKIRKSGCNLPIMVFNIQNDSYDKLWEYKLEPEVYSLSLLKSLAQFAETKSTPLYIHLKVDTGMNRLGITKDKLADCLPLLKSKNLIIRSIFSHLSASENQIFDDFTKKQFEVFDRAFDILVQHLEYRPIRHILNTGGIIRFPERQYEMVRIGLGLYGIDETQTIKNKLQIVHTLKARIIQIKTLQAGETTGYSRAGKALEKTKIAIVGIGYADGLMRLAGNGNYHVFLNGQKCPTIGNVCMDVMMIDISHVKEVQLYEEVEIFGVNAQIEDLSRKCNTISYEIISRIAPRVKRVYTYE